jgi:hypothetical protein
MLCDGGVEFVVIGGVSATLHGSARVTYESKRRSAGRRKDLEAAPELEGILEAAEA